MSILSIAPAVPHRPRVARRVRRVRAHRSLIAELRAVPADSLLAGAVIGGFVPTAVYWLAHFEVAVTPAMWAIVAGGALFSASTVWDFTRRALGSRAKAAGFVVLVEGVLIFAGTPALGWAALALLVGINAFQTGSRLGR